MYTFYMIYMIIHITSFCSMIMHSPMLQRSVHNSWKLKTSQFLHGQHSPDMSPIEHILDALDRRIRHRVPVPLNIQQLCTAIEEEWTNIPQATINNLINSMRRRCVALHEASGSHTRYWLLFGPQGVGVDPRVCLWSASWYATPVRWMDYVGKGEVLINTDFDIFVNNIWEK